MEKCNLMKLNKVEGKEHQVNISQFHSFGKHTGLCGF
jgi:hypothetical protein